MEPVKGIVAQVEQLLHRQENSTRSQPASTCSNCNGDGYFMKEGKAHECQCAIERRVMMRLPSRYQQASLLDFSLAMQTLILDWLESPGDGLLLTGPTGTGKTHLAAAIVRTLVMIRYQVIFRRCADLYAELRETYRLNLSEGAIFAGYFQPRLLVLDDLGAGGLTDHERRSTLEVLDQRLNARKSTVITSNWSIEQIAERMDDRIASRLTSLRQVELAGADRRAGVGQ